MLPEHALREHIHEKRLVVLCPGWIWKEVALYALAPSRASLGPMQRAFITMLQDQLARDHTRWKHMS